VRPWGDGSAVPVERHSDGDLAGELGADRYTGRRPSAASARRGGVQLSRRLGQGRAQRGVRLGELPPSSGGGRPRQDSCHWSTGMTARPKRLGQRTVLRVARTKGGTDAALFDGSPRCACMWWLSMRRHRWALEVALGHGSDPQLDATLRMKRGGADATRAWRWCTV
jgi:hypothetical protein